MSEMSRMLEELKALMDDKTGEDLPFTSDCDDCDEHDECDLFAAAQEVETRTPIKVMLSNRKKKAELLEALLEEAHDEILELVADGLCVEKFGLKGLHSAGPCGVDGSKCEACWGIAETEIMIPDSFLLGCRECGSVRTVKEWDRATIYELGERSVRAIPSAVRDGIDCFYHCPVCNCENWLREMMPGVFDEQ